MEFLRKYNPKAQRKILFLVAGIIWGFAGFRVFDIGFKTIQGANAISIVNTIISAVIFCLFFFLIFKKLVKKHTKRVINKPQEKQCVFSFFDLKSYCIMAFMISLGIWVRSTGVFPIYVGDFYIGLGLALFGAGVLFIINFVNFRNVNIKYLK